MLLTYLWFLPRFDAFEERTTTKLSPFATFWRKIEDPNWRVKKILKLFGIYGIKGVPFLLLVGTLYVLLTDIGWLSTYKQWAPNWEMFLLMARASGTPNGAHMLSYIPLPLLGLYVAYKYRKDYLLDCFQGILIVAFGVAFHELPWLAVYLVRYYGQLGLYVGSNFIEDAGFTLMCVMFVYAYWKRGKIPLRRFSFALYVYGTYIALWFIGGLPVTTINNFQIGSGPFMVTTLWADPWVNFVEIVSWILVAVLLFWESKVSS